MIKLSEIESKTFKIEITDGDVREYDLIDLVQSLSSIFNITDIDNFDPTEVISNMDKIKDIFNIEGLKSSQAMSLLEHVMVAFEESFAEVKDLSDVKKKELDNLQNSSTSE